VAKTSKSPTVKHREVARALRQEVQSGLWQLGERLPGEQDLARRFEVAHMTMRQAVANLVEEGLLTRIAGKGTFVVQQPGESSSSLRTQRPMALLFPADAQKLDPYYFPEVFQGFQHVMEEGGYRTAVYSDDLLEGSPVLDPGAAVACLLFEEAQVQRLERLRDSGFLVLAINRYSGRRSIPSVYIDDAAGVELAVDHLVALGHNRIGFIAGPPTNLDAIDRLRGFRSAVKKNGLRVAPEAGNGFNAEQGYAGARRLLSAGHRPTAIVCASDLSALGAIKAARDLGLSVPRGLSVIGFGDFSVADYMLPGLTTVRQTRFALGAAAAEALVQIASGINTTGAVLSADLIVRESTAENIGALAAAP